MQRGRVGGEAPRHGGSHPAHTRACYCGTTGKGYVTVIRSRDSVPGINSFPWSPKLNFVDLPRAPQSDPFLTELTRNANESSSTFFSSCKHRIHEVCYQNYFVSIVQRVVNGTLQTPLDLERGEFKYATIAPPPPPLLSSALCLCSLFFFCFSVRVLSYSVVLSVSPSVISCFRLPSWRPPLHSRRKRLRSINFMIAAARLLTPIGSRTRRSWRRRRMYLPKS